VLELFHICTRSPVQPTERWTLLPRGTPSARRIGCARTWRAADTGGRRRHAEVRLRLPRVGTTQRGIGFGLVDASEAYGLPRPIDVSRVPSHGTPRRMHSERSRPARRHSSKQRDKGSVCKQKRSQGWSPGGSLSFFRINATRALKMRLTQRLCGRAPTSTDLTAPYDANFMPANRPRATCPTASSYQSGGFDKFRLRSVTVSFAIAQIATN
jgi:hypothetical protein